MRGRSGEYVSSLSYNRLMPQRVPHLRYPPLRLANNDQEDELSSSRSTTKLEWSVEAVSAAPSEQGAGRSEEKLPVSFSFGVPPTRIWATGRDQKRQFDTRSMHTPCSYDGGWY